MENNLKDFRHEEHQIDARDANMVTYIKDTNHLICEASMLECHNIKPKYHIDVVGNGFYIWLWSEKFKSSITLKKSDTIFNGDNKVADVYLPYFGVITCDNETLIRRAVKGLELHILNT